MFYRPTKPFMRMRLRSFDLMITYKTLKSFIIHSLPLNLTKTETGICVWTLFSSSGANHFFLFVRFYMVFIGRDMSGTKGLVYFKQDISQIDLFVFFSVFFSSFFLVVSVSVFAWKMKQYHTRRRVIEHRVHQLETMRSRPFATYSFLHQTNKPQPCSWRIKRDTAALLLHDPSKVKQHPLKLVEVRRRPLLAPVSQEPTNDGRASVTTVIFQLPGNECSDVQLLLGSSLTLSRNQNFVGGSEHFSSNARQAATRRTVTFTS